MKLKLPIYFLIIALYLGFSTGNVLAATLTIKPETISVAKEGTGSFNIVLDTEGANASAADAYITIEGSSIEFTSIQPTGNVDISEVFENSVNQTYLRFSFVKTSGYITGSENIATVSYTAKDTGITTLTFKAGDNYDSSTVANENADEILTATGGLTITVGSGSSGSSGSSSSSSGSSPSTSSGTTTSSSNSEIPDTGVFDVIVYMGASLFLLSLGVTLRKYYLRV